MTGPPRVGRRLLVLAEVALAALTLAAALGFNRVFLDGAWQAPVLAAGVASHALAASMRRLGWGAAAAAAVSAAGLVLAATWLVLGDTAAGGVVPTGDTWRAAGGALAASWQTFQATVAPAPAEPGFVLAAVVGVWAAAFLADTSAFRFGTAAEAAVPSATLFLFCGALAAPRWQLPAAGLFLSAVLVHMLAARALRQAGNPTWLATDPRAGARSLFRAGAVLAVVAVAGGVLLGPALPGASSPAAIPWRAIDRQDDESRITVSPLVDIRSRLVQQSESTVFTVRATARAYWRLTALESFDGQIWSSTGSYRRAGRELPGPDVDGDAVEVVDQEITIRNLESIWLPAAYRPTTLEGTEGVKYHEESATLVTEQDTSDGLRYRVRSQVPLPAPERLRDAEVAPEDPYLTLPPTFSPRVTSLAAQIVSREETAYGKALALQAFFRAEGRFVYDLSVPPGHGGDAMERFLFEDRRGYCEQFAGAYAAMARAVGLPARVAVGFTPGELEGDSYRVRGRNAHAWPEVHLAGLGWVAFEPTPGRGIPGGEAYTGVAEAQVSDDDPTTGTTAVPAPRAQMGENVPGAPTGATPGFEGLEGLDVFSESGVPLADEPSPWPRRLAATGLVLAVGAVTWVVGVTAARVLRRWWRRHRATLPQEQVRLAWTEAAEAAARLGAEHRPWETPGEFATRAARRTGVDRHLLDELAAASLTADYAPAGADQPTATAARRAAAAVERAVRWRVGWRQRARELVDPRPLLPRRERLVIVHSDDRRPVAAGR